MQDETDNTLNVANDIAALEAEVCSAVERGHDVQETVRQLTLRKIGTHSFDIESLRQIMGAVLNGARAGVQKELQHSAAQTDRARAQIKEAVAGLDAALAQLAEASRLALEEAASRAQTFSREDLSRARSDLESLEAMLLETLQASASGVKDVAHEIFSDIVTHIRIHGSAVGRQLKETVPVIVQQLEAAGRTQVATGLHLAQATSDLLRQIAAGVLTGVAARIRPGHTKDKGD
ncbi:MAG: DUF6781 family protein [Azovibrio sp.]|uniref:DUF6781 family protein n=1 Tax=Azovibrio sp. TaxID=1872673 RepID=UPI003C770EAC